MLYQIHIFLHFLKDENFGVSAFETIDLIEECASHGNF